MRSFRIADRGLRRIQIAFFMRVVAAVGVRAALASAGE